MVFVQEDKFPLETMLRESYLRVLCHVIRVWWDSELGSGGIPFFWDTWPHRFGLRFLIFTTKSHV